MQQIARTPKQVGEILHRTRRALHVSQSTLGEKSGLWQETISRVEKGSPGTKLETLFDLLAALDLEVVIQPRRKNKISKMGAIF